MSSYTTQLRYICESLTGHSESVGYNDTRDVITAAVPLVFDFDFPIFDENHRNTLCSKIIAHYYNDEIAYETVGLFKFNLRTKMNEIMPYYNTLYTFAEKAFKENIMNTKNLTKTAEAHTKSKDSGTASTDTTVTGSSSSKTTNDLTTTKNTKSGSEQSTTRNGSDKTESTTQVNDITHTSDTPMGALTDLTTGKYMTSGTVNKGTTTGNNNVTSSETGKITMTGIGGEQTKNTGTVSVSDTDTSNTITNNTDSKNGQSDTDTSETVTGYDGTRIPAELFGAFREKLVDIDLLIINELQELFISIW